ncbi:hypothetical protein B1759_14980 [Rubrivirga sp. SAORIC476]|uniref:head-tail connector protein n=1 Tax=Rubrivirga sp. SAORIC476 TaxID=1961794 RepID=UPI000BA97CF6|nr:phage head-tail connector protein [Rubrivirga sp. SAORIC476]PAP79622.1 hypothetical protein B1759_14980 [Rubrivirga sp. SAORIC476]
MQIVVVQASQAEPVSLAEARAYLRVTATSEDSLIEQLVTAARLRVEETTGYALGEQRRKLTIERWPCSGVLEIPSPPLLSVQSVKVADFDGVMQTLAAEEYSVIPGSPGAVCLTGSVPTHYGRPGSVEVVYTCGLGADGGEPIPDNLLVAIKALTLHLYDMRGLAVAGTTVSTVPASYDFLTASHRYRYRLHLS